MNAGKFTVSVATRQQGRFFRHSVAVNFPPLVGHSSPNEPPDRGSTEAELSGNSRLPTASAALQLPAAPTLDTCWHFVSSLFAVCVEGYCPGQPSALTAGIVHAETQGVLPVAVGACHTGAAGVQRVAGHRN